MHDLSNVVNMVGIGWRKMLTNIMEQWPDPPSAIVIVFDKEGTMHTHIKASPQEIAIASARLLYLAHKD
jgi:hypothetical protein